MTVTGSEKGADAITPAQRRTSSSSSVDAGKVDNSDDAFEVFKRGEGTVDFRTVGWIHTSVIFLKGMSPGQFDSSLSPTKRTSSY